MPIVVHLNFYWKKPISQKNEDVVSLYVWKWLFCGNAQQYLCCHNNLAAIHLHRVTHTHWWICLDDLLLKIYYFVVTGVAIKQSKNAIKIEANVIQLFLSLFRKMVTTAMQAKLHVLSMFIGRIWCGCCWWLRVMCITEAREKESKVVKRDGEKVRKQ